MIKRIVELLDYLKNDISPKGLDYVFPETRIVIFHDDHDQVLIEYERLNSKNFIIKDYEDLESSIKDADDSDDDLVSDSDMLLTIKQAISDKYDPHKITITKLKDGYEIHVFADRESK